MNPMLSKMIEQYKDAYKEEDLNLLIEIENDLKLSDFNSDIALEIGNRIVKVAKKYNEDLIVKIIRLKDNETVFLYMGDSKASRNIGFADMKANSTRITGHSSIYALIDMVVKNGSNAVFEDESNALPVGGAFPIYVGDEMVSIIAVSGMHNGMDHRVIVEGLANYLNKDIKEFKGVLI